MIWRLIRRLVDHFLCFICITSSEYANKMTAEQKNFGGLAVCLDAYAGMQTHNFAPPSRGGFAFSIINIILICINESKHV